MNKQIVKIQMPIDTKRARAEGRMFVDQTKKPEMLLYARFGKHWVIYQEDIWDLMMSLCDGKGSMKSFFEAYYDKTAQKWIILQEVDDQPW